MDAPDRPTRVAGLESRLAALVTTHAADHQVDDRLRRALDHDSATDAYSRGYFDTALAHELRHFRRDDHDQGATAQKGIGITAGSKSVRTAIGHVRVSTDMQATEGVSLEAMRRAAWAAAARDSSGRSVGREVAATGDHRCAEQTAT